MAPNTQKNASNPTDHPEDLLTAWIAPAKPQWESLLLAVSGNKRIFLRVKGYDKATKTNKWLGVELSPAGLHELSKKAQEGLKVLQGA